MLFTSKRDINRFFDFLTLFKCNLAETTSAKFSNAGSYLFSLTINPKANPKIVRIHHHSISFLTHTYLIVKKFPIHIGIQLQDNGGLENT